MKIKTALTKKLADIEKQIETAGYYGYMLNSYSFKAAEYALKNRRSTIIWLLS